MKERILAVGGDRRQRELARLMESGRTVDTLRLPGCADTAVPGPYSAVLLPCPALDAAGRIRAERSLPLSALAPYIGPGTRIFGGGLDGAAVAFSGAGRVCDLLQDPFFTAENGRLTAEAAVLLTMGQTWRSLYDVPCAVLGYGRIGRVLARLLQCLGARTTVVARRKEVLAEAGALGFRTAGFAEAAGAAELIFNTVPAPVLTPAQAAQLPPDTLWIELASAPGGLPEGVAPPCGVLPAGGLPGRLLPLSAARALRDAIERNWEESHEA